MLTGSSTNYINPDYLVPLPTSTDAKNSPLALLAATCNNIGKDDSAKSIIPPIDRKDKESRASSQPSAAHSASPHKRRSVLDDRRSPLDDRTRDHRHSPRENAMLGTPKRERSAERITSPQHLRRSMSPKASPSHNSGRNSAGGLDLKTNNSASKISVNCGSLSVEINHKELHGSSNTSANRSPNSSSSSLLPPGGSRYLPPGAHTGLLSTYYPHLAGLAGGYPSLLSSPLAGSYPGVASAAAALFAGAQKSEAAHIPVTYTTVKTTSGATTLVPVCADPYCGQCKLSVQSAQFSASGSPPSSSPACPSGCNDCNRDKASSSQIAHHQHLAGLHRLASLYPGAGLGSLHGGSGLSSSSSSPPSLVCNWVGGGKYCGERFPNSEELMTHLRSHTSALEQQTTAASNMYAANLAAAHSAAALSGYTPATHPALAALSQLYPHYPPPSHSPTSPHRSAQAALPRSLSPNSILSASRYHPYMKSPLAGLSAAGYPGMNGGFSGMAMHPGLASYPGLYGFPGGRLGPLVP